MAYRNSGVRSYGNQAQTCHIWAQQTVDGQGQSQDGRISFDGPTIFSYGRHFPIAHFVSPHVVLLNADKYSVTTSGHQSMVRSAVSHKRTISVPNLKGVIAKDRKALRAAFEHILTLENVTTAELFCQHVKRFPIPSDIARWNDQRKAKEAKRIAREKIDDARLVIGKRATIDLNDDYRYPERTAETYKAQERRRLVDGRIRKLFVARNTAARHKLPLLVKRASATIKLLRPIAEAWKTRVAELEYAEARSKMLQQLEKVRAAMVAGHKPGDASGNMFWNYETTARLAACAFKEGMPDVGAHLVAHVNAVKLMQETAPPSVRYQTTKRVTIEQWKEGQGDACMYYSAPTMVRKRFDTLQTSLGAECPWSHALLAFQAAQRCRTQGKSFEANGHKIRVGHFGVDRISPDGTLTAGCHTITYDEMLRLAVKEAPEIVRPTYPVPMVVA